MLYSAVYSEAHPRPSAAFASRMNMRDVAHSAPTSQRISHPSAPLPGQTFCKLAAPTTPTAPTGTLHPFSFQSLAGPCSPSCSNEAPFISFNFILLQTLSLTTDGYTPLPTKKVQLVPSEAEGYPVFRPLPIFPDPACPEPLGEIRPGRSRPSFFTGHGSPNAVARLLCAPRAQTERTNCALFRSNSFACHTSVFNGGVGVYHESIEPDALCVLGRTPERCHSVAASLANASRNL
jgi:hypothetical protein